MEATPIDERVLLSSLHGTGKMTRPIEQEIIELKKDKKAVILAHNYERNEVQDIADFVGDSLALARQAANTNAEVIIFCGVYFMAETANILSPEKTVILPDINAGCPLADMAPVQSLRARKSELKDYAVVTYINSSAAVKAESDICCTSSNAVKVIESVASNKILFLPDKNLALWAQSQSEKEIKIWPGFCQTHHHIKVDQIIKIKEERPGAEFMAHPECTPDVTKIADFVGSTSKMFEYGRQSKASTLIVGSEMGMLHRLKRESPSKEFILPTKQLVCPNMKKTTLTKIRDSLINLEPKIVVEEGIREKALVSVQRMLEVN